MTLNIASNLPLCRSSNHASSRSSAVLILICLPLHYRGTLRRYLVNVKDMRKTISRIDLKSRRI